MISIALHIFDFLVYLVYFQSRRLISCIFPKQTAHILISFKLTMDIIERVQQFPKLPRGFAFGICLFQICRMNSYRDSPHAFARRFGSLFSFSDKRALILSFYCFLLKISSSSLFFSFWWIFRGPFLWVHTLAGCGLGLWAPQSDAHYPCRHILFCFFSIFPPFVFLARPGVLPRRCCAISHQREVIALSYPIRQAFS